MIVHTMSLLEIASEIQADYQKEVDSRLNKFFSKFRRLRMQRSSYPWLWRTDFITKRKNTWYGVFYAYSKKDACATGYPNFFLTFRHENHTWAAYCRQGTVFLLSSHFFERYVERYLEDKGINESSYTTETIARVFFTKNYHLDILKPLPGEESLRGFCEDGMILGDWISQSVGLIKTFLSRKELKPNQMTEYFDMSVVWLIADMFMAKNDYTATGEELENVPPTYLSVDTWNRFLHNRGNRVWIDIAKDCNNFMLQHKEEYKKCTRMLDVILENRHY